MGTALEGLGRGTREPSPNQNDRPLRCPVSRPSKLFRSPAARPSMGRKSRLGVEALESREVPATFAVTRFDDPFFHIPGELSLRQAISQANANPGPDIIQLKAGT